MAINTNTCIPLSLVIVIKSRINLFAKKVSIQQICCIFDIKISFDNLSKTEFRLVVRKYSKCLHFIHFRSSRSTRDIWLYRRRDYSIRTNDHTCVYSSRWQPASWNHMVQKRDQSWFLIYYFRKGIKQYLFICCQHRRQQR